MRGLLTGQSRTGDALDSAAYTTAASLLGKAMGLVRGVVVARLLVPSDLGAFVLVAAVLGAFEVSNGAGLHDALIHRERQGTRTHQAVWTVSVLRGTLLMVLVLLGADAIVGALGQPSLAGLLRAASVVLVIRAMSSVSVVLAERAVNLRPIANLTLLTQIVEFATSVALVWATRNAWGLIGGMVVGALVRTVLSYRIPGFRPGIVLALSEVRDLWRFGRWRIVSGLLWYVSTQGDDLLVGRLLGTGPVGIYGISYRLAHLPTTEIAFTSAKAAFPSLARTHRRNPEEAGAAYLRYLSLTAGLAAPIGAVLAACASPLVYGLLGDAYADAVLPIAIMSLGGVVHAIVTASATYCISGGLPQIDTVIQVLRAAVLVGSIIALAKFGIVGVAIASVLSLVVLLPVCLYGGMRMGVSALSAIGAVAGRLPAAGLAGAAAWWVTTVGGSNLSMLVGGAGAGFFAWGVFVWLLDPSFWRQLVRLYQTARRMVERSS